MKRIKFKVLAAVAAAVTLAIPAANSFADPEDPNTDQSAPLGIMSPTAPSIDSVDGTGLRSVSDSAIDSVDGTGLQSGSSSAIDSVDGTGLRGAAIEGTDSVDGTGVPLSFSQTDLAASGEELLTVPASMRATDCIPSGDAASADSTDCTPSGDDPDSGE